MDTKKVELLLKAVDIGSLKRAAELSNYTQSGIVYAMNALEKECGIRFISRDPKGISLTPEGKLLRPYLEDILTATKRFDEMLEMLHDDRSPSLDIGVWPSIARSWLPDLLRRYQKKYPDTKIHVDIATKDLSSLLRTGAIDCALGPYNIAVGDRYIHLKNEDIYVAVPSSFPFPDDTPVSLDELTEYPVFLTSHFAQGPGSKAFQDWYLSLSSSQKIRINSSDGLTLLSMVEQGYGIAFLSHIYKADCPKGVRMLPLTQALVTETILALSPVRPATKALNDLIREVQLYVSGPR